MTEATGVSAYLDDLVEDAFLVARDTASRSVKLASQLRDVFSETLKPKKKTSTGFGSKLLSESSKLELPLTHGKVRGHRGQYPIRLVYASNIPVILMAALLANVNMFTLLFWSHPTMSQTPLLGRQGWFSMSDYIGTYEPGQTAASGGFAWYASMPAGVNDWLLPLLNQQTDMFGHSLTQIMLLSLIHI